MMDIALFGLIPRPLRLLGPLERCRWHETVSRQPRVVIIVEVSGRTTIQDWQRALDEVRRCHPLLGVEIALDYEGRPAFFDLPRRPFPLEVSGCDEEDWKGAISIELKDKIRHSSPLARAVLLHGAEASTLMLVAHAAIADASALSRVMSDLLTVIGGGSIVRQCFPAAVAIPRGREGKATSLAALCTMAWSEPHINSARLSPALTARLDMVAHRHGLNLGDLMSAALVKCAQFRAGRHESDMRRVLGEIRLSRRQAPSCCVVESALHKKDYTLVDETDVFTLARSLASDFSCEMRKEGSNHGISPSASVPDSIPLMRDDASSASASHRLRLGHLGHQFAQSYGAIRVDAVWGPLSIGEKDADHTIATGQVNGRVHILYAARKPFDRFLERTQQLLERAADEGATGHPTGDFR
ncbi:hypothetical protein ACK9YZ_31465 [Rhizobium sp. ZK1]|uniref:hypothetical protein n=1 Tax=Rhizobium sp. ZK1 TaxID=3389872 RepID=UPI0039F6C386